MLAWQFLEILQVVMSVIGVGFGIHLYLQSREIERYAEGHSKFIAHMYARSDLILLLVQLLLLAIPAIVAANMKMVQNSSVMNGSISLKIGRASCRERV